MKLLFNILIIFLLAPALLGLREGRAEPRVQSCTPSFAPANASAHGQSIGVWLGANDAHSIVRPDGSTVWLFGNSRVNYPGFVDDRSASSIPNSIAVSRCSSNTGQFEIEYHWEVSNNFDYEGFFQPRDLSPKFSYVPGQPWYYGDFLFVPLLVIEKVIGDVGYRIAGTHLARVWNPEEAPAEWKVSYGSLSSVPEMRGGQAAVTDGAYVYLFNGVGSETVVSRLRNSDLIGSLGSISERIEYLNNQGSWRSAYRRDETKRFALPSDLGITVSFVPSKRKWMALFRDSNGTISSPRVMIAFADTLLGGWSRPTHLTTLHADASALPSARCFSVYGHQAATSISNSEVSLTYSCQETMTGNGHSDPTSTLLRFLRVPIPAIPATS